MIKEGITSGRGETEEEAAFPISKYTSAFLSNKTKNITKLPTGEESKHYLKASHRFFADFTKVLSPF